MSVAAGISCAQIENSVDQTKDKRTDDTTGSSYAQYAALVKCGATGIARGTFATDADMSFCTELFEQLGVSVEVPGKELDLITGLSGSGPAYVMRFIEAMSVLPLVTASIQKKQPNS